ncbi:MAG TPA: hypothetical protein VIJ01_15270 [Candidatus Angelobacter sp.]
MLHVNIKAKTFRQILWLILPVSLVLWAYLRLQLGLPAPVDALLLIALVAEAALILGYQPAR